MTNVIFFTFFQRDQLTHILTLKYYFKVRLKFLKTEYLKIKLLKYLI